MRLSQRRQGLLALLGALLGVWAVFALLTGMGPWTRNPYNSYTLQALSWLEGRLDLGQNYTYLELAIYEGKYYVSFPPLPSILLLPLAALFGTNTPDHLISGLALVVGGILAYLTALRLGWAEKRAAFAAFFLTLGSNLIFVGFCGWVWFLAQTLSFAFTMAALYCALGSKRRDMLCSLFFLCCAAGCRPFQLLYLPLVLLFLCRNCKGSLLPWVINRWWCALPTVALGCVYMALNYARFGSILEFGHNYLPEFTEAKLGQFSLAYLPENLYRLVRLPPFEEGRLRLPQYNGFNLFLVSPLFLSALLALFGKKQKSDQVTAGLSLFLCLMVLLLLCAHKTMGGWQFGNRYTIDALPLAYIAYLSLRKRPAVFDMPFALFGFALNLGGSIVTYLL